jgi:hypothetical protein
MLMLASNQEWSLDFYWGRGFGFFLIFVVNFIENISVLKVAKYNYPVLSRKIFW